MSLDTPHMGRTLPRIAPLDEAAINRIAAGEVVERPASAAKELIENALDAGARRVDLAIEAGGKTLLRVTDDGHGIPAAELPLALARHATSKIDGRDLVRIHSFGFRGEALASLAAAARVTLASRPGGAEGAQIAAEASRAGAVRPVAMAEGTRIEVRDLFQATPARLKFLRSDRAEAQAIAEIVRRFALARPDIAFVLADLTGGGTGRCVLRFDAEPPGDGAREARAGRVLGAAFRDNALSVAAERDGMRLGGLVGLPTYSRATAAHQHLYVNGRPVRDRLLAGALRAAYGDLMPAGRHAAGMLFLDLPPEAVDVNVHPAKAEVRFRDPGQVRGLIVGGLKHVLAEAGHRAPAHLSAAALGAFRRDPGPHQPGGPGPAAMPGLSAPSAPAYRAGDAAGTNSAPAGPRENGVPRGAAADPDAHPLGAACAQVHGTYVIAQTADGIAIIDQHAAHERLVYEKLKAQRAAHGVSAQALLIPDIVDLGAEAAAQLLDEAETLATLGLVLEPFGPGAIAVRAVPALLGQVDARGLLADILEELQEAGESGALAGRLDAVLARIACHGSVRAGRALKPEEMDALLREMEATPHSGQCNHGRPTHVSLRLNDIERLFERR